MDTKPCSRPASNWSAKTCSWGSVGGAGPVLLLLAPPVAAAFALSNRSAVSPNHSTCALAFAATLGGGGFGAGAGPAFAVAGTAGGHGGGRVPQGTRPGSIAADADTWIIHHIILCTWRDRMCSKTPFIMCMDVPKHGQAFKEAAGSSLSEKATGSSFFWNCTQPNMCATMLHYNNMDG